MRCLQLPRRLHEQLLAAARARPEQEICGLISARGQQPLHCYPVPNVDPLPQEGFEMAPAELVDTFRRMREHGEQLWAIYHSHPYGPATPSARDLSECGYPEALQLIITPKTSPCVHAWQYSHNQAYPWQLEIT